MVLLSPGISLFPQLGLKREFVQVSPLYKSMVASSLLQNKISLHSMWLLGMVIMSLIRWVSVLISILIEINDAFFSPYSSLYYLFIYFTSFIFLLRNRIK